MAQRRPATTKVTKSHEGLEFSGFPPRVLGDFVVKLHHRNPRSLDSGPPMCHSTAVTLFGLNLRPGQSIFDQVVFAAKKAFISGEFQPGQAFPSVRALAIEFRIHPNTAHKIVQYLIQERWLEVIPGVGTVVAPAPEARAGDKKRLLKQEVEQLVVEAKRVGLELDQVMQAIAAQWEKLDKPSEVARK
jgi:GntR family transcriptional regulator